MKKLLLMSGLTAAMLTPGVANAYTASEIAQNGQNVIELFNADNLLMTIPIHSDGDCSFEASGSTLTVKNVYGKGDLNITVSGTRGTIATNGQYNIPALNARYTVYAQKNTNPDGSVIYIIPMMYLSNGYSYYTSYYGDTAASATKTADIDSNGDGTYALNVTGPFRIVSYDKNNQLTSSFRINFMQFESFIPNVDVTDELHDYQKNITESRAYKAEFIKKSDTLYEIRNWGTRGQAYTVENDWSYDYKNLECTLDFDNLSAEIGIMNCEQYKISTNSASDIWLGDDFDGETIYSVIGSINLNEINHTPDQAYSHLWTTNNGTAKTHAYKMQLLFPNCQRVIPYLTSNPIASEYKNSVVTFNNPVEITHVCDLALEQYGYGTVEQPDHSKKEMIYIKGQVIPVKNNALVDNYELYVVAGQHTSVTSSDFNHEDGHINGYNIEKEEYYSDYLVPAPLRVTNRAGDNVTVENNGQFIRMIPVEDLPVKSADNKYSFYVKVNYLPEYNLAPTFHNLSYVSTPTGIDTAIAESNIDITAGAGEISVSGASKVEIYTLSGAQVYAGGEGTAAVAAGIYVVKADGAVRKITVK